MQDLVFITGNQGKADHLALWLGRKVPHHKLDLDEIQSLDLKTVVEHKVQQAYELMHCPVLVEDIALTFTAMGRLPGTFIKWFLEELGNDGLCKLANSLPHRTAVASICYALYDGTHIEYFENHVKGTVSRQPRGSVGFGWNPIFIPQGSTKTYAEMTEAQVRPFSVRAQAIDKLAMYLNHTQTRL